MNESEQAQAITEIKAIRNGGEYPRTYYRAVIDKALAIVDSQAQKIAEQAKTIEINAAYAVELQGRMQEQAKEIDSLNKSKGLQDEK